MMRTLLLLGVAALALPANAEVAKWAAVASDEFAKAVMAPRKGEVWIYTTPS